MSVPIINGREVCRCGRPIFFGLARDYTNLLPWDYEDEVMLFCGGRDLPVSRGCLMQIELCDCLPWPEVRERPSWPELLDA